MKDIEYIILHHSDSEFGDVALIRHWHTKERNFKDVGYNGIILNGWIEANGFNSNKVGLFEIGRGMDLDRLIDSNEVGAQAFGYNKKSLGICLIGKNSFHVPQFQTALYVCALYQRINPLIKIIGHYECENTTKTCPNFGMIEFRKLLKTNDFSDDMVFKMMEKWIKK